MCRLRSCLSPVCAHQMRQTGPFDALTLSHPYDPICRARSQFCACRIYRSNERTSQSSTQDLHGAETSRPAPFPALACQRDRRSGVSSRYKRCEVHTQTHTVSKHFQHSLRAQMDGLTYHTRDNDGRCTRHQPCLMALHAGTSAFSNSPHSPPSSHYHRSYHPPPPSPPRSPPTPPSHCRYRSRSVRGW